MSNLVHVGIRPKGELTYYSDKSKKKFRKTYHEALPKGGYKVWTSRMLNSGCNKKTGDIIKLGELIYCPHCKEYFSEDQFKKES